jgi:uncharacterized protein (TIGR03435 family)
MSVTPGRLTYVGVTLMDCIAAAYGLKYFQISGPDWLQTKEYRYDIVAKAEGTVGNDELMRMLQTLLTERFQLAVHHETKELPVYSLTVGKNGSKPHPETGTEDKVEPFNGGLKLHASMLTFTGFLTGRLGRPVLDNTGLAGIYEITVRMPDLEGKGIADAKRAEAQAGPSLWMDAVEELGLKLQSQRASVDYLIVDRVEKIPMEN